MWDTTSWAELIAPDNCEMVVEQLGLGVDADAIRAGLEASYAHDLEHERPGK